MAKKDHQDYKCSFCGKGRNEVKKLIAGPTVFICDQCVGQCNEIMDEGDLLSEREDHASLQKLPTPREISRFLDDYVIGQEQAKKTLAVAVYNHYKSFIPFKGRFKEILQEALFRREYGRFLRRQLRSGRYPRHFKRVFGRPAPGRQPRAGSKRHL